MGIHAALPAPGLAPRHHGQEAGHQRQTARRDERHEPGGECQREARRRALELLSLFLAAIAAVYVGLAVADGRLGQLALQAAYLIVTGGLIWLGLRSSPYWLAVGYFAHGGWDLLNHSRLPALRRRGALPDWYAPACVAYDWVIALLVVLALG